MKKTLHKLITKSAGKAVVIWLLWHLPTLLAVAIAMRLEKLPYHVEDEKHCLMCQAHKRLAHARHAESVGSHAKLYCIKCGLDKEKWPRFCANKTKQVNYKPQPARKQYYHPMFWE